MEVKIKQIDLAEVKEVVEVHELAFPGFFLTQLGSTFLCFYYESVLKHKKGVLFGAYVEDDLVGFCAATQLSKSFNTSLIMSNFASFIIVGLRLLFTNPKAIFRLANNLTKTNSENDDAGEYAEILSIGVDPNQQGGGVGRKLLEAVENELRNSNIDKLSLTTDYQNNENAIGFYKSLKYKIMYDFVAYPNRKMYRLIKNI